MYVTDHWRVRRFGCAGRQNSVRSRRLLCVTRHKKGAFLSDKLVVVGRLAERGVVRLRVTRAADGRSPKPKH
jgi:hypothetical protein